MAAGVTGKVVAGVTRDVYFAASSYGVGPLTHTHVFPDSMQKRVRALVLLAALAVPFISAGCGTIIHGTRQTITLNSTPEGAQILENGQVIGTTPTQLRFKRGDDHLLTFRLDGYEDVRVELDKEIDTTSLVLNLLFGGLIGFAVDFSNGAAYALDPSIVDVILEQEDVAVTQPAEDEIHVVFFTTDQVARAMETLAETPAQP